MLKLHVRYALKQCIFSGFFIVMRIVSTWKTKKKMWVGKIRYSLNLLITTSNYTSRDSFTYMPSTDNYYQNYYLFGEVFVLKSTNVISSTFQCTEINMKEFEENVCIFYWLHFQTLQK